MTSKITPEHQKRLEQISSYLKELRLSEGLTQQHLSQTHGLKRNSISRAETAKNITLVSIFKLADALGVSIKELFEAVDI